MDNLGFQDDENVTVRERQKPEAVQKPSTSTSEQTTTVRDSTEDPTKCPEVFIEPKKVELQRTVGLFSGCGLIVGSVIGSGIFISPKGVYDGAGSVGLTLMIWIACGLVSFLGALAYAELGTVIPENGAEFTYFLEALAPNRKTEKTSWWRQVIPFLYQFQGVVFLGPAGLAVLGLTSATYLVKLATLGCPASFALADERTAIKLLGVLVIITSTAINCTSIQFTLRVQNTLSTAKVIALVLIILGGFWQMIVNQEFGMLTTGFDNTRLSYSGISQGFYSALWAYGGWQNLNNVMKELINPQKNLLKAFLLSLFLITTVYTFTNVAYFSVLSREDFANSAAVAETFALKLVGSAGAVIVILSVASSAAGTCVGGLFLGCRTVYAAGQEGHMVDFLSFIHVKKLMPSAAIIFNSSIGVLFLAFDIYQLIYIVGFVGVIFNGLVMGALFRFRYTKKDRANTYKAPLIAPLSIVIFSIFLTIGPLVANPKSEYLLVLVVESVGILIYTVFVHFKVRLPCMDAIRKTVQKVLMVVPVD